MIPQEIISRIKERASTFEVIQTFSDLVLKKEGVNYKTCCPFHGEKTPSFIVSPQKDRFKCYGCGASGNGIDFLMQDQNLTYIDAIRALAKHYSIEIPGESNFIELKVIRDKIEHEKKLTAEEQRILDDETKLKISKQVFHLKKTDKKEAALYLSGRALDLEIIKPDFYYQSNAFKSEHTGIEFPLSIAFLDSTETIINKRFIGELPDGIGKSRNTGNMANKLYTKTFQSGQKDCYLLEGVINAMSVFQGGKSALATFSTSNDFTDATVLARYLNGKNIYLAFDNDKAGLIYAVKMMRFLFDNQDIINFVRVYMFLFPAGQDANDCLKEGILSEHLQDRYNVIRLDSAMARYQYEILQQAKKEGNKDYIPTFEPDNLYNFEKAKKAIDRFECCHITTKTSLKTFQSPNTVGYNIKKPEALRQLKSLTNNLVNIDLMPFITITKAINEDPIYQVCKQLVSYGFNLKVSSKEKIDFETGEIDPEKKGFIEFYTDQLRDCVPIGDTMTRTEAVKKAAEFLSTLDASTYIIEYANVYKKFGLNKTDWNSIAKEYLSKEKYKHIYSNVSEDDGVNVAELMDPNNLPAYVDTKDFYRKGYYAAQDKEGKECLYMFRTDKDGLFMASNFAIKMIGHLYNNERSKNKRIIRITDEYSRDFFMEIESAVIRSFNDFSNRIYEESNLFFFGSKRQFEILLKHVSNNIPKWIELEILGQNKDDFFAFADGIYNYRDKQFIPIDELGTVTYKNTTYYLPVFSSIYQTLNGNSEQFSSAKYLKYEKSKRGTDFNHTSFYDWTNLMNKVYQEDNTGMFAVVFVIMSAFRELIHNKHRRFPLFFLSGPTNSGKSQVADSIQAPFAYGMQIFNLNSGTDAAFFVSLEKYRNIPMIFDEYNDVQIAKIKFQGLKAGYDGIGKQKKKDVTSKELDMSEVNCSVVYLGQEIPEQDDYALFNRSISFFIPVKDYSPADTEIYDDLKRREEKGLTNILTEILNHRAILEKHYYKYQIDIKDNLKKELQKENSRFGERILNSVSEFLAVFKIFLEHSDLKFAFDYETFYAAGKAKLIKLSEMIQSGNRLTTFFQTITYLFNTGKIMSGREFKIENRTEITIRKSENEKETIAIPGGKKVIFIRINLILPHYRELQKNESLKISLLGTYLKDSQAFLGNAINENFDWFERKIVTKTNQSTGDKYNTEEFVKSQVRNTTAVALIYDKLDLELEKFVSESSPDEPEPEAEPIFEQSGDLPF